MTTDGGATGKARQPGLRRLVPSLLRALLFGVAGVVLALHFLHLRADFPNGSPWMDWSKYTDEGWYGDGAIRQRVLGHWYLPGDFNPAVALPVWPLMEAGLFHFTGVSLVAARALAVGTFVVMLACLYVLMQRYAAQGGIAPRRSIAGLVLLLLLAASPFFFAFSRLAILEPPLAMWMVVAMLLASFAQRRQGCGPGWRGWARWLWPQMALGLALPAAVLTKTTAVALLPAVLYLLWERADRRPGAALRLVALPALVSAAVWSAYFFCWVRPHYLEDYAYLFSANGYTGFQLQPLSTVLANTVADGRWMGTLLYGCFFAVLPLLLLARPRLFRNPLLPAFLLWAAGYLLFLGYHNNLQPRYYLLLAIPVTAVVALGADALWQPNRTGNFPRRLAPWRAVVLLLLTGILVPDLRTEAGFLQHATYGFADAAQAIAAIIRADAAQRKLLLSVSGSDLTLMTGLPSIDDDFGTDDLDERVARYRPGWYVAWNQVDDDKMNALSPLYQPVRVASFPVMDDPERNQLILYRLDPAQATRRLHPARRRPPRPLRTRLGQQPTTTQLEH